MLLTDKPLTLTLSAFLLHYKSKMKETLRKKTLQLILTNQQYFLLNLSEYPVIEFIRFMLPIHRKLEKDFSLNKIFLGLIKL